MIFASTVIAPAELPAQSGEGDEEAIQQAQKHFDRGAQLYLGGEYRKAIVEFRKAKRLQSHPVFAYNIARAYQKLDECGKTLDYLDEIENPKKLKTQTFAKSKALRAACESAREGQSVAGEASKAIASKEEPSTEEAEQVEKSEKTAEASKSAEVDEAQKDEQRDAEPKDEASMEETEPDTEETVASAEETEAGSEEAVGSSEETEDRTDTSREAPKSSSTGAGGSPLASLRPYLEIGAIGAGTLSLTGGLLFDLAAKERFGRLARADEAPPKDKPTYQEVRNARSQGEARRARTIALYATGAALVAGGTASLLLFPVGNSGQASGDSAGETRASVRVGFSTREAVELEVEW